MRVRTLLASKKFWCSLLLLPFLLIAGFSVLLSLQPRFDSDEHVMRHSITAKGSKLYQLSYLEGGDPMGQRVILVHGTPGEAANWYGFIKNAPKGFLFYAVDRPGFGKTRPSGAQTSLMEQAQALAPLIDMPGGKPILVGHSLGGPIVAAAAALYGDRIKGIVIAAGSLDPDLEEVMAIQHVGNIPPISWLLTREYRNANKELIALEGELRTLAPKLPAISMPVCIVHGTADTLVPYENVEFMTKAFTARKPDVITLEGQNHFLPWNSGTEIMAAIKQVMTEATSENSATAR
ncbi:MAG: alpha/beta hydrolase [Alphaproteobacteria bacterium]|nr:alpha/beta hydrolase [Alphaproteobacteria bacterium]